MNRKTRMTLLIGGALVAVGLPVTARTIAGQPSQPVTPTQAWQEPQPQSIQAQPIQAQSIQVAPIRVEATKAGEMPPRAQVWTTGSDAEDATSDDHRREGHQQARHPDEYTHEQEND